MDVQITVTRDSLSLLINRPIPLEEWVLISALRETSSVYSEPDTQHFWNPVDNNYGVYRLSTIGPVIYRHIWWPLKSISVRLFG